MTRQTIDNLKDAVALTTSMLHAQDTKSDWTEPYRIARELDGPHGAEVMMAMAHVTTRLLHFTSELAAAVEEEGITVEGVPGGVTPLSLLQELGRQIIEEEARDE